MNVEEQFKRQVLDLFKAFLDKHNARTQYIEAVEKYLVGANQSIKELQQSPYSLISGAFIWTSAVIRWGEVDSLWKKEIPSWDIPRELLNKDVLSYDEILTALNNETNTEEVAL